MRSDRIIHASREKEDEDSSPLDSQFESDSDLIMDILEHEERQTPRDEDDREKAIMVDVLATQKAEDGNMTEVASKDDVWQAKIMRWQVKKIRWQATLTR
ncbi:hypothetical protein SLA2020_405360 [Shorea laevis]